MIHVSNVVQVVTVKSLWSTCFQTRYLNQAAGVEVSIGLTAALVAFPQQVRMKTHIMEGIDAPGGKGWRQLPPHA